MPPIHLSPGAGHSVEALRARLKSAIAAAVTATQALMDMPRSEERRAERVEWSLICGACVTEMKRLNRIISAAEHRGNL